MKEINKIKFYLAYLFILVSACANAQAPSWLWAKSAGGNAWDKAYSIASDNAGNLYITGEYNSASIVFGLDTFTNPTMSSWNMFLVKYDATGNVIWAKSATGSDHNQGNSVATDNAGNIYVAGYFSSNTISFDSITLTRNDTTVIWSNLFLVKYDSSGNVIWARNATKGSSTATAITTDDFGNIFVAGGAGSDTLVIGPDTLFPTSNYDKFVAKYDTAGNALWARGLYTGGFTIDVEAPFITADKLGNLYVTGCFHVNTCIIVSTPLIKQGADDIYLAKFNPAGSLLWAKRYGDSGEDKASSIATDTSGNIYITGYFAPSSITFDSFTLSGNGYTAFVVKLDAGGSAIWAEKFGRLDYPAPSKIVTNNNGDVFVTGYFTSPALVFTTTDSLINQGLFLAKYDYSGNFKWARDAIGGNRATGVTVDVAGNPCITGYFSADTLIFDSIVLLRDSTPSFDIYVATINSVVSIGEINAPAYNGISVFPNPSAGSFFILTKQSEPCTVIIFDMMGKEILSKMIDQELVQIDISAQPKGIYFVTLQTSGSRYSKKIIIQ